MLPLSNPILATIKQDIEANRSSTAYETLFADAILELDRFVHQGSAPKYDDMVKVSRWRHDDIKLIMSKLPSCFSAMDIIRVINVFWLDRQMDAVHLIKYAEEQEDPGSRRLVWDVINDCVPTLYAKILRNPIHNNLIMLARPIYFWDDECIDPEIEFEPDKSIDEMDEIFRTQYERFSPIDESQFRPIDEKVSDRA